MDPDKIIAFKVEIQKIKLKIENQDLDISQL
jgi:hypothetical protein